MSQITTKEIANLAGVSVGTVDRVIHNRGQVADKTRKKIQEIIYDEQPCIFLFVPKELIAINKKFSGIGTSAVRPGYRESSFLPNNM